MTPLKLLTVLLAAAAMSPAQLIFSRRDANTAAASIALISADFNGDSKADIAQVTIMGTVAVLSGRGDGSFEASREIIRDPVPARFVIAADVNGDGRPDLVSSHQFAHVVAVALSRGDGFSPPRTFPSGTAPHGIAAADFNGDGKIDLAVANNAGLIPSQAGRSVSVLLGRGDGTFGSPLETAVLSERPFKLAVGDFNRDGKNDLAVLHSATPQVSVLIGKGDGTFLPPSFLNSPSPGSALEIADFNRDGQADVALLAAPLVMVFPGKGDGTFQPAITTPIEGIQLATGDFNADGIPDLASVSAPLSVVVTLLGRGDGTFEDQQPFQTATFPTDITVTDFNGDGMLDLATSQQQDGLTVLLNTTPRPSITANGVVNAASFLSLPLTIAPGEIVTIFGRNLGPSQLVTARLRTPEFLDTVLERTRVLFDGIAAPLIYVREDQLSAVVPYGVSGRNLTQLQIVSGSTRSAPLSLRVAPAVPGIFTADASGTGQAAVLNQNRTSNSAANPAAKGSIITFFATGEGTTNPPGVDGKLAAVPLSAPVLPVIVGIANQGAEVLYVGAAPGLVSGLLQINVRIPTDAPSGPRVPLVIRVGDAFSQAGVSVAVQ